MDAAKKLYKENKKDEAKKRAQSLADKGFSEAWYWLGTIDFNPEPFYEKAAEKGHSEATKNLIETYLIRAGNKTNLKKISSLLEWIKKNNTDFYSKKETMSTIQACLDAGDVIFPKNDLPSVKEIELAKKVKDCAQWKEGISVKIDLVTYKHCLLSEKPDERDYITLMEVYANGWGTDPNFKLAQSLACFSSSVPAEMFGITNTLTEAIRTGKLEREFHFCDYVTSGLNGGICAQVEEQLNRLKSEAVAESVASKWSDKVLIEIEKAKTLNTEFAKAEGNYNYDQYRGGTIAPSMYTAAFDKVNNADFTAALETLANSKYEVISNAEFKTADDELNEKYKKLLAQERDAESKNLLKAAQRNWNKLKMQWGVVYTAHYKDKNKKEATKLGHYLMTVKRTQDLAQYLDPK